MAADGALEGNARILRHLQQRSFVVERSVSLDRPQRQRTVHRSTLEVDVGEFARQAGSDGALARSGGAVDGDDEFALGWIGHRGNVRFYTARSRKTTGAWGSGVAASLKLGVAVRQERCRASPAWTFDFAQDRLTSAPIPTLAVPTQPLS